MYVFFSVKLKTIYANLFFYQSLLLNVTYILDKMYQLLVSIAKLVNIKIIQVKEVAKIVRLVRTIV